MKKIKLKIKVTVEEVRDVTVDFLNMYLEDEEIEAISEEDLKIIDAAVVKEAQAELSDNFDFDDLVDMSELRSTLGSKMTKRLGFY